MNIDDYDIVQETHRVWRVVNKKTGKTYRVWRENGDKHYTCTCLAFEYQPKACKHIIEVLRLEGKIK